MTNINLKPVIDSYIDAAKRHSLLDELNIYQSYLNNYTSYTQNLNDVNSGALIVSPEQIAQFRSQLTNIGSYLISHYLNLKINFESVVNELQHSLSKLEFDSFLDRILSGVDWQLLLNSIPDAVNNNDVKKLNNLNSFIRRLQLVANISDAFNELGIYNYEDDSSSGDSEISIIFQDAALITKLGELSKAADEWKFILNGIARLLRENDTDVEILSVKRGSLIVTIGAITSIVMAVTKVGNLIMDFRNRMLEGQEKIIQLKKLNISFYSDALDLLEKSNKILLKQESEEISKKMLEEYQIGTSDTDYHEIHSFLTKAIKKLIKFTNKGGKIKPKLSNGTEHENQEVNQLLEKNIDVRLLENRIAALENGKHILQLEEEYDKKDDDNDGINSSASQ